jgi:hypothetical protein
MTHLNEIYAHHAFEFWILSIIVAVLLTYSRGFWAFVKAIPAGAKQALRKQREARLERLQAYADDKTRVFRFILMQACLNALIMGLWTLHSTDRLFFRSPSEASALSDLVLRLFNQVGAVYVLLTGLMQLVIISAFLALAILWTFRDPEAQIVRLRQKLNDASPLNASELDNRF